MNIVLCGSLSKIGQSLVPILCSLGSHQVFVITSKSENAKKIKELGATPLIGDLNDSDFLTNAFQGADAVYSMIPSLQLFEGKRIAQSLSKAIKANSKTIKRVVHMNGAGPANKVDAGLLSIHYEIEDDLIAAVEESRVKMTILKPTSFYSNLYRYMPEMLQTGTFTGVISGNVTQYWISETDIASAISEELIEERLGNPKFKGMANVFVRYLVSERLSMNEIAASLSKALQLKDLKYSKITEKEEEVKLMKFGMPGEIATGLVRLNKLFENGDFYAELEKEENYPKFGNTRMVDFLMSEFVPAFKTAQGSAPRNK